MAEKNILSEVEKQFGLPPLSQVADTLQKFPDAKQLQLIREVLILAESLSHTAPELDKVVALIREINSLPTDRLEKLEKVLKRLEKIIKESPKELIAAFTSLKEE